MDASGPLSVEDLIALADSLPRRPDKGMIASGWEAIEKETEKIGIPPDVLHVASDLWVMMTAYASGQPLTLAAAAVAACSLSGITVMENKQLPDGGVIGEWKPSRLDVLLRRHAELDGAEHACVYPQPPPELPAMYRCIDVVERRLRPGVSVNVGDLCTADMLKPMRVRKTKAAAKRRLDFASNVRRRKRWAELKARRSA